VVDFGNITNFLKLTIGTTINMNNLSTKSLTDTYTNWGNLQWSAFASVNSSIQWVNGLGTFPADTLWYTLPGTNVSTQTAPPNRGNTGTQQPVKNAIDSVGVDTLHIASDLGATNADNNSISIREPLSETGYTLDTFISDSINPSIGDFGGSGTPLAYDIENITPNIFNAAQRSDLWEVCPAGSVDPYNKSTNAADSYLVGYFIFNSNGTMTFTRAAEIIPPPVASFYGSPTTGTAPLQVSLYNISSGDITNWIWNLGNGTIITNTTGSTVTGTYSAGGNYTVILTVVGPGGRNSLTNTAYITVSSASASVPVVNAVSLANGKFIFSGTNGTASQKFRVLASTNLTSSIASWVPIYTNNFLSNGNFAYTNSTPTNRNYFFRLVSP
jgi:hypothetical protein